MISKEKIIKVGFILPSNNKKGTSANRHASGKINIRKNKLSNITSHDVDKQIKSLIYNEMIQDVAEASSSNSRLSYEGRYAVLHNVTWNWTQYNGIFEGNELWSKEAYDKYMSVFNGKHSSKDLPQNCSFSKHLGITEDHVVPRKVVIDHILDNPYIDLPKFVFNKEEVLLNLEQFIRTYLFSCVITSTENSILNKKLREEMPDEFYDENNKLFYRNPWARYISKEIDVYRCSWKKTKKGNLTVWEIYSDENLLDLTHYRHSYI